MKAHEARAVAQLAAARRLVLPVLTSVRAAAERGDFAVVVTADTLPPRGDDALRELGYRVTPQYKDGPGLDRPDKLAAWEVSWA